MHIIFGLILIVFFIAALCVFGLHGLRMVRRERMLAEQAAGAGLKFSREDPFEIPVKYAGFSLMRCGHSQIAYNVAFGRAGSCDVQAFDFSYESGHGFERATRRYGIMILGATTEENVLMWSQYKPEHMPLVTGSVTGTAGPWRFYGSQSLAEKVYTADVNDALEKTSACIEILSGVLMICIPYKDEGKWNYNLWLEKALRIAHSASAVAGEENASFQVS